MELVETSVEPALEKQQDSARQNGGNGVDRLVMDAAAVAARVAGPKAPSGNKAGLGKRTSDPKAYARSRVSNSRDELPNVDGRSLIARRFREIARSILIDHQGGEGVSEVRLQLIRRFSAAAVLAEAMEAKLANGEEINVQEHALLCSSLVRIASRIGIARVPKDAEQLDPLQYAREHA